MRGKFITLEGGEGTGKSTQARALVERLKTLGLAVTLTREPGGSPGAEVIRHVLLSGAAKPLGAEAEAMLFAAAREDHIAHTIKPALDRGQWVVCDRFADSTRVYQGAARADLRDLADRIQAEVIGLEPDLTFVIDMDPGQALARGLARRSGEDRFEAFGADFQTRLRSGFRALAAEFPGRCVLIDGARPEDAVAAEVLATALARS